MFKNLKNLVSKAEPGKSAFKSCDSDRKHRKHENSCNCEEVLTTWFAIVTRLCRVLRLGCRFSKGRVNILGMSKCWPQELLQKLLFFSMLNEEINWSILEEQKREVASHVLSRTLVQGYRKEKANTCLLALRSTHFPLGNVFQEAWKLLHQTLTVFNAGGTHLIMCDAAGQDLALLLATVPCLFARPRSDRFHQVLCLHAAVVLQCSLVPHAAGDSGAKVVLQ